LFKEVLVMLHVYFYLVQVLQSAIPCQTGVAMGSDYKPAGLIDKAE
jgi:hypothetical protein